MSQPFDRSCKIPEPGKPNEDLGEFWEESPWTISSSKNLSAYERNRVYMNHKGNNFFDISYITGADSDGDARCAVAADLNNDGLNEIIVRQVGGGPLHIYENRFPLKNWLKVSLRGIESNSFGIGARLTALVNDEKLVREMYPVNSYRSQSPNIVHFGLNDSDQVDILEIKWPSGRIQRFESVQANRHIIVEENYEKISLVQSGQISGL